MPGEPEPPHPRWGPGTHGFVKTLDSDASGGLGFSGESSQVILTPLWVDEGLMAPFVPVRLGGGKFASTMQLEARVCMSQ